MSQNIQRPAVPRSESTDKGPDTEAASGASPFPPDVERLLHPISAEKPSGEFLLYEGTYDRIRDARRADDPNLPRGVWETDLKKADWREVTELCFDALENRTKDLQIAVWLLEALLHRYRFDGVREGLKLLAGLCEKFWDSLYPEIEADDLYGRIAPAEWMNRKLSIRLKLIPVTRPDSRNAGVPSYTFADKERSDLIGHLPEKEKINLEDEITQAAFLRSVMYTPKSFYAEQVRTLTACLAHLEYLDSLLEEKCGSEAPGLREFRETLEHIRDLANGFLKAREKEEKDHETEAPGSAATDGDGPTADDDALTGTTTLSIRSRAQAYRILSEVADYLLIREPHSPVPHLLKRAVRWGDMSLPDLLQELVNDDNDRYEIFKLLALKTPENSQ
ncbi:type VI secretion system protein TssA [Desulfonema ishimotonii]|uniref:Type VI secretion system protein TssA n=1 Tax=Desulfonema ishimotonii TaxID=45657 RepID=A0A401FYW9_9BACT|nr:type VI secretion system protein TssA [Desulfonema ishimotonii]GBC62147.1 type VI secretion system protein TssA [Desulfonema ishimotonii]